MNAIALEPYRMNNIVTAAAIEAVCTLTFHRRLIHINITLTEKLATKKPVVLAVP